ncbi:MAG: hypothetical protein WBX30_12065 [Stellaceae bacterium]
MSLAGLPAPTGAKMVRIWGSAMIAGSLLGILETVTGSPASAFERRIELTNNTRMAIVEIQIAQIGTGRWERDLLGDDILLPAQSVLVDIDDGTGNCRFDIKTVFDDGTSSTRRDIDVCAVERFAISYR